MLKLWLRRAFQFRNDPLGKCLAEFNAPLIEGIDLPDRALGEDEVFVERHEFAQRCRRDGVTCLPLLSMVSCWR